MTDKIKLKADKFVNDKKLKLNYIKPKDLKLLLAEFCEEQMAELEKENLRVKRACHKWFMRWREAKKDALYFDSSLQKQIEATLKLQQEIAELKTKKIPELERKIASIRGSHSVDAKKLNARIEQVERLKKENAELKEKLGDVQMQKAGEKSDLVWKLKTANEQKSKQLTKAKEIIKTFLGFAEAFGYSPSMDKFIAEAEQFLKDSEVENDNKNENDNC